MYSSVSSRESGVFKLFLKNSWSHGNRLSAFINFRIEFSLIVLFTGKPMGVIAGTISSLVFWILIEKRLLLKVPPNQHVPKPRSVAVKIINSIRYPKCSRFNSNFFTAPTMKFWAPLIIPYVPNFFFSLGSNSGTSTSLNRIISSFSQKGLFKVCFSIIVINLFLIVLLSGSPE